MDFDHIIHILAKKQRTEIISTSVMKFLSIILYPIIFFSFLNSASAQSLTVEEKNITYTRKNAPDHKKHFEVIYPIISGKTSPEAINNISQRINYWNAFGVSLEETLEDYNWLDKANFNVNFNKNNIFCISITIIGCSAYCSESTKNLVFDIRSGKQLGYADLFIESKMSELLEVIRKEIKKQEDLLCDEVKEHLTMLRKEENNPNLPPDKIRFDHLQEFTISDEGVVFLYNYVYHRFDRGLQPDGFFLITFEELKPFIKPGSLLQNFVP